MPNLPILTTFVATMCIFVLCIPNLVKKYAPQKYTGAVQRLGSFVALSPKRAAVLLFAVLLGQFVSPITMPYLQQLADSSQAFKIFMQVLVVVVFSLAIWNLLKIANKARSKG